MCVSSPTVFFVLLPKGAAKGKKKRKTGQEFNENLTLENS
jgi:hypothetical protein